MTILAGAGILAVGFAIGAWWTKRAMTNAMLAGDYDQAVERAKVWRDRRRGAIFGRDIA